MLNYGVLPRAINIENDKANKIKNVLNGEWGGVPEVARYYKSMF
jgi:aconitate hydratase